jgi:TatD DNase family protein
MENVWYSFSGVLTFKNAESVREIFNLIPVDKVMFETDAPWLTPEPHRGKTNFSKYVTYVVERAAELRNLTYEQMVEQSNKNISDFFGGDYAS